MMHRSAAELEAGLAHVRRSPRDQGTLELIVRRPAVGEREVLEAGRLDTEVGLVGDTWITRGSRRTPDGGPHPGMQVTLVNARAIAVLAGTRESWPLAGDQLYVDFDLSDDSLPVGSTVSVGDAVLEVTGVPHTGCAKFRRHFGEAALRFVNSPVGRHLHLRGINTRVVEGGPIQRADPIRRAT
jgi:MOSC domain-containing protein YiiM